MTYFIAAEDIRREKGSAHCREVSYFKKYDIV